MRPSSTDWQPFPWTLALPLKLSISTNSELKTEKNGTFVSPATALASMVLPGFGWLTSRMPLEDLTQILALNLPKPKLMALLLPGP